MHVLRTEPITTFADRLLVEEWSLFHRVGIVKSVDQTYLFSIQIYNADCIYIYCLVPLDSALIWFGFDPYQSFCIDVLAKAAVSAMVLELKRLFDQEQSHKIDILNASFVRLYR